MPETRRRALSILAGLIVAVGPSVPAPAQAPAQNDKVMSAIAEMKKVEQRRDNALRNLPNVFVMIAVGGGGLFVLVLVFLFVTRKPGASNPDAAAMNDYWVRAQMRKDGRN